MKKINVLLILAVLFVSCNTNKSVIQTTRKGSKNTVSRNYSKRSKTIESTPRVKVTNDLILNYIEKYSVIAQSNMRTYGIPASIILGQALLESGYGTAALCLQANNHFGIKCHKDWAGSSVQYDDDTKGECFRKYNDPFDSFRDHAVFLTSGSRYSQLFSLDIKDYKAWARGLKAAGYATDSQYPSKLITLIERYELYNYDNVEFVGERLANNSNARVYNNNRDYKVQQGDTLYSISKKFNLTVDELKQKNNFEDNSIAIGQTIRVK
ncbi:glucosaminidase domain-containing protein [Flavobacterium cellulosilyticum]|uniref:Peptidoglycan hydrolase n=1 Tax=Flavobacterium cellulosilyticum TaxID=2541731 RepID=A0A4R5C5W6_9FLAO|nr:glucosaminidase domain-containing protein [Flavobacterium cellulosilyticum]TDD94405.1 LysM peptidoglycan-binding domain-containing protein [Flavobacterium cellulosilyticum]